MSHLITIAERIKVITNIQKTTYAMQLISMSALSRIASKKKPLQLYTQQLETLTQELIVMLPVDTAKKPLYLIIGSQKGFCGSFNIHLFNLVKSIKKNQSEQLSCIAVGSYAYDFCISEKINVVNDKIGYSLTTISQKVEEIFTILTAFQAYYDTLIIISNYNASIFLQRPEKTVLPLRYQLQNNLKENVFKIEQPLEELSEYLGKLTLKNQLFHLMLESLRAENSARALSMDNSSRNAKNLLGQMKLEYNKMRQAKVTKELTELSSSLLD